MKWAILMVAIGFLLAFQSNFVGAHNALIIGHECDSYNHGDVKCVVKDLEAYEIGVCAPLPVGGRIWLPPNDDKRIFDGLNECIDECISDYDRCIDKVPPKINSSSCGAVDQACCSESKCNEGLLCHNNVCSAELCAGTDESCGTAVCESCKDKSKFYKTNEELLCTGPNILLEKEEEYRKYVCVKEEAQACGEVPQEEPETKTTSEFVEFCKYGCGTVSDPSGAFSDISCSPNMPPVITSAFSLQVAKRGEKITINSTGYDPNVVFENANSTKQKREKISLGCSSVSSETGSSEEFEDIGFNADICEPLFYLFSNPSCTFNVPKTASGNFNIYCRAFDGELWSDEERSLSVYVDAVPPKIEILSPAQGSIQQKNFAVKIKDTDESALASCSYEAYTDEIKTREMTDRPCSADLILTVGPGKDCPVQGSNSCTLKLYASDTANNTAKAERTFSIRYLFSNITLPAAGTYQHKDFNVFVVDTNLAGPVSRCEYRVRDQLTADWRARNCSAPVKITVGERTGASGAQTPSEESIDGHDCATQGEDVCIVEARAFANSGDVEIEGAIVSRTFSIDYTTPYSEITSPQSGGNDAYASIHTWIADDFSVRILDNDPSDLGLSKCEYSVLSKGIETVAWTERTCNGNAQILLGSDCKDEGGKSCTVRARAFSVSGNKGFEAERNFSIILSDVVLDGFATPLGVVQTDTGLIFSGTPRQSLNLPIFRVCSASASVSECRDAYSVSVDNCNINGKCLCGSLNKFNCPLKCNDRSVDFYYLSTAFVGSGQVELAANIYSAECPSFQIDELNKWLASFTSWEQQIFVMQQQSYQLLQQEPNNTELQNSFYKLTDALLLVTGHLQYMQETMQDLSASKSKSLIIESEKVKQQLLNILNSIGFVPTHIDASMEIPYTVRLNETVSIPVRVSKQGTLDAYAKISCLVAPPSGNIISRESNCISLANSTATYNLEFLAGKQGQWDVYCNIENSFKRDCGLLFPIKSINGSFSALPPLDLFIKNVQVPASAELNSTVTLTVAVENPDVDDRFANVQCSLAQPCSANSTCSSVIATSDCSRVGYGGSKDIIINGFVNKVGTWTVGICVLKASTRSDCEASTIHNISTVNRQISVLAPPIKVLSIIPQQGDVPYGSNASAVISLENSRSNNFPVVSSCIYRNSLLADEAKNISSIVPASSVATINVTIKANATGAWKVLSCSIYLASGLKVEERNLNSTFNVGLPPAVCGNNACEQSETADSCPDDCTPPVNNKCGNLICEQGESFVSCSSDCLAPNTCTTNADTPGTNDKCYCQNTVISGCPSSFSCQDHKCITAAAPPECVLDADCDAAQVCTSSKCVDKPTEEQPKGQGLDSGVILFIAIIVLVILIPIIIFLHLKHAVE
ncbi:MAG: hypothetical protein HY513_01415 [Candidatus Aenigmarchaeota archaeon]|nr:hypothetical protein [Candidatus Aenigmarchaeota archaeon]